VPSHITELFKATRLDIAFDIYDNEESALKSFEVSNKVDKLSLRRRFKRLDVSITAKYKIGVSSSAKLFEGKVLNISGDGIFIHSKKTYPASSNLYIELWIKGAQKPLILSGTVIWLADKELQPHSYPGMGLEFTELDDKTQSQIIDFIEKNITGRSRI